MGHGLLIWRYVFVALRGIFRGACKRRFFLWEGKGRGTQRRRQRQRKREREMEKEREREREREKGLVGIYPLDCTTSTEWATKYTEREKGNRGGNWAKHSSGQGEKIMILKSGDCILCLTLDN